MYITLDDKKVKQLVSASKHLDIAKREKTMPILQSCIVESWNQVLVAKGTDLESSFSIIIGKADFSTLPFAIKYKDLPLLSSGELNVTRNKLTNNGTVISVLTEELEDQYPNTMPGLDPSYHLVYDFDIKLVSKSLPFCSSDETRYNINTIYLESNNGIMKVVTTDGHRLSIIDTDKTLTASMMLPRQGSQFLTSIFKNKLANINHDKSFAQFKCDNDLIQLRLVDGQFPDYRQVIPKTDRNSGIKINFDVKKHKPAIRDIVTFINDKKRSTIKFDVNGSLKLSASTAERGTIERVLDASYSGEAVFVLSGVYLLDAFNFFDAPFIAEQNDSLAPVLCTLKNETVVIMPMRFE